jgi:chlorophyll synthase
MKPITWVPVVWSFWCGALVGFRWELNDIAHLLVGLLLSGPLLCGMSQAINDYFDREVDAVNEPARSIPSQNITLMETYRVIGCLGFFGLLAAYYLGQTVFVLSLIGIALGHAYSAPPFRLKRFTWLCPLTSATSYIALPWLAAASLFGGIQGRTLVLTALYTLGAMGIMISNDFKSITGDYALKLPSVPVVFGTRIASRIVCVFIDCAQLGVITFLLIEGRWLAAGIIFLLMLPQLYLQKSFIQKPLARAIWYNARGQSFFVLGMLVASCLAL